MKWTMATKKRWPTIPNGRSSDSQETLKHSCCRLSTGLWWWSPRLASSFTSRRTLPSTWVTAWRTCWSTGTASTTSSTSRTTPPSKPSCSEAKSWRVRRNWAVASPRIGYFSAGWMCQGTPADRCGLGTRRWLIPTRNKQLVHSETQNSNATNHLVHPGDPSGGPLLRDPAQRESQRARVRCLVHSCCHAGDPRVCRPGGSPHFLQPLLQILQISYPYFFLRSYFCAILMLSLCSHVVLQGATNIFTSVHSMDLKISQIDSK